LRDVFNADDAPAEIEGCSLLETYANGSVQSASSFPVGWLVALIGQCFEEFDESGSFA